MTLQRSTPYLLFLVISLLTWLTTSHLLSPSLDEGIYLNGGWRVLNGQTPYLDFFAFTGPLTYWMEALLGKVFGYQIPEMRIFTAVAVGLIGTGAYQLAKRIAGHALAVSITIFWFAMTLDLWHRLGVNHRWMSAGLYSLGGAFLFSSTRSPLLAGVAFALAIWTTQSFAVPVALLLIFYFVRDRVVFKPLFAATVLTGLIPLAILWRQEALTDFVQAMFWASSNYANANRVRFGYILSAVFPRHWLSVYSATFGIPLALASALAIWIWKRERAVELPLVFCGGLLLTAYPKWDTPQLLYLTGPFVALGLALLFRVLPERQVAAGRVALLVLASYYVLAAITSSDNRQGIALRSGNLSGIPENVVAIARLEERIPENATLFVYPYMTALYPILHARNPIRYEYLQPGMMSPRDEAAALADLEKTPPQFIYWHNFPATEILKIWPNTDPARLNFPAIENFIKSHYDAGPEFTNTQFIGRLWTRKVVD